MSVGGASASRHGEQLESPLQSPKNILTHRAEPTILSGKSRVCFFRQGSCCDAFSLVCFVLPSGGDARGEASAGSRGWLMQILILLGTVALSLATALLTASGILTVLLKVMVRLR